MNAETQYGIHHIGSITSTARFRSPPARVNMNILDLMFMLSIALIAFNAMLAADFLGEARTEPYVLVNLFIAPFAILSLIQRGLLKSSHQLNVFIALFFLAIIASVAANRGEISTNELRGRTGYGRVITTTLVPLFGFYFAYLTHIYARAGFYRIFALPLLLSTIFVVAFGDIELLGRASDAVYNSYKALWNNVLHGALDHTSESGRIQSVTAEASNFGMYVIFITPFLWAFCGYLKTTFGKSLSALLIANLIVLSVLSGRTSLIGMIAINLVFFYVLLLHTAGPAISGPLRIILLGAFILVSFLPLALIAIYKDDIAMAVVAASDEDVSNLSRFGTMAIQIDIFFNYPIFGVGIGQYPFSVPSHMLSWAETWEFKRWVSDPDASFFPSFSIYTRMAAELGIVGYGIWTAFSYYFIKTTLRAATYFRLSSGRYPLVGIAIICGFFGTQLMGWNIASYKVPYIWIIFGLAAAYSKAPGILEFRPMLSSRRRAAVAGRASHRPSVSARF